jgi:hypothetical protein
MMAVGGDLVSAGADRLNPIDLHQSPDTTLADSEACLFEFHRHPRTTIAAQAQAVLLTDMSQHCHIRAGTLADRSRAPRAITALTDVHDTAKQFDGPTVPPAMHKSELHGLWLAKN